LDHFDDYQKHFTVMNYRSDAPLKVVRRLNWFYVTNLLPLLLCQDNWPG